jgi:hypothetical protein
MSPHGGIHGRCNGYDLLPFARTTKRPRRRQEVLVVLGLQQQSTLRQIPLNLPSSHNRSQETIANSISQLGERIGRQRCNDKRVRRGSMELSTRLRRGILRRRLGSCGFRRDAVAPRFVPGGTWLQIPSL